MTGPSSRSVPAWGARTTLSGVRFGLWAPALEFVDLLIDGEIELLRLQRSDDGWHTLTTPRARAGSRYWYILPDGARVADPASSFQPEGLAGPSQVIDHSAYRWRDIRWRGLPWHTAVIHELQLSALLTGAGFNAVREQLRALVRLGVTAVQLKPIDDLPYAPDHAYGTPDDLRAFVEEAHGLGLMVLLDAASRRHTLWGSPLRFDGAHSRPVRDFVIGRALHWLEKYHVDGLRVDAVHQLRDDSPKHILAELAEVVRSRITNRQVHLVLEQGQNPPALLERNRYGDIQLYNAQWNAIASGEGFQPLAQLPPDAFVSFLQNHEQAAEPALRAFIAIQMLMPQIPFLSLNLQSNADLAGLRYREIIPRIPSIERGGVARRVAPCVTEVIWRVGSAEEIVLIANLSAEFVEVPVPRGRVLWLEGARGVHGGLRPWSVLWLVRPALS